MRTSCTLAMIGSVLSSSAIARANVVVNCSQNCTVVERQLTPTGWRVTIESTQAGSAILSITAGFGDQIEYIRLRPRHSTTFIVTSITGAASIGEISRSDSFPGAVPDRNVAIVDLVVEGDVGSINVTNLVAADIGGDVTGNITLVHNSAENSPIGDLIIRGDLLGDVTTQWGQIDSILVDGKIGVSALDRSQIRSRGYIGELVADRMFADIDSSVFGESADIGRIETLGGSGNGDFVGSISAQSLAPVAAVVVPEIVIADNLDADVTLAGALANGDRILVNGSFMPGRTITVPMGGVGGQITFGNDNLGGSWDGDVVVGGATLSAPSYAETAVSLGDGAVGLVPFGLHGSSSLPVHDASIMSGSSDAIEVRHYGPIGFTGAGAPVTVQQRAFGGGSMMDLTSDFIYSVTGAGGHVLTATPMVGFTYQDGFEYIVTPVTTGVDRLFCAGAAGNPGVAAYEYRFAVGMGSACAGDLDGNGQVDSGDLATLLGNWGASGAGVLGDLDGDEVVGSADLSFLLGSWGPCAGARAVARAEGPTVREMIDDLGFETVDAYVSWIVDSMTERDRRGYAAALMDGFGED